MNHCQCLRRLAWRFLPALALMTAMATASAKNTAITPTAFQMADANAASVASDARLIELMGTWVVVDSLLMVASVVLGLAIWHGLIVPFAEWVTRPRRRVPGC